MVFYTDLGFSEGMKMARKRADAESKPYDLRRLGDDWPKRTEEILVNVCQMLPAEVERWWSAKPQESHSFASQMLLQKAAQVPDQQ